MLVEPVLTEPVLTEPGMNSGAVNPHAIPGLALLAEQAEWPWQTRLHARSAVRYLTHLIALQRQPRHDLP
jgi:hypothetical protein